MENQQSENPDLSPDEQKIMKRLKELHQQSINQRLDEGIPVGPLDKLIKKILNTDYPELVARQVADYLWEAGILGVGSKEESCDEIEFCILALMQSEIRELTENEAIELNETTKDLILDQLMKKRMLQKPKRCTDIILQVGDFLNVASKEYACRMVISGAKYIYQNERLLMRELKKLIAKGKRAA